MNITKINFSSINRIIAHEIHPKTPYKNAYSKHVDALLTFTKEEKDILLKRLQDAIISTSKTFQLDFEDKSKESIYNKLKVVEKTTDKEFIEITQSLADDLANAHFRTKIPGGYCLVGCGKTNNNKYFFFIIKAELQEVFNVTKNRLVIIKDVFLSPAKDFYKVGIFIQEGRKFIPFMYDDQFSLQKKDLTEYFYGKFLGLTTDKNDKLKSKNFYDDTKSFIDKNVKNLKDKLGLFSALTNIFREDTSGLISAKDFSENYFEGNLKIQYDKKIVDAKYPISFTRNIELIDNKLDLQRISIPLTFNMSIVGSALDLDKVEIIEDPTETSLEELTPELNNGEIKKLIILKQG
ncbi:nucleoid-associated protein [uncultured Chryseobacterium sp.]|uniref:nucleoid-associated protein n=1 Tax=uncultured Chryseobacterium sp. TaxID=259322 RepID=UPI0025D649E9|nr:nucleoid-associated protein [uncultured Chryseobacterium sp.]